MGSLIVCHLVDSGSAEIGKNIYFHARTNFSKKRPLQRNRFEETSGHQYSYISFGSIYLITSIFLISKFVGMELLELYLCLKH